MYLHHGSSRHLYSLDVVIFDLFILITYSLVLCGGGHWAYTHQGHRQNSQSSLLISL